MDGRPTRNTSSVLCREQLLCSEILPTYVDHAKPVTTQLLYTCSSRLAGLARMACPPLATVNGIRRFTVVCARTRARPHRAALTSENNITRAVSSMSDWQERRRKA